MINKREFYRGASVGVHGARVEVWGELGGGGELGGDIREHVAVTLPIINTMCRYLNVMAEAGRLRAELV